MAQSRHSVNNSYVDEQKNNLCESDNVALG